MELTDTLSQATAARRVKETSFPKHAALRDSPSNLDYVALGTILKKAYDRR